MGLYFYGIIAIIALMLQLGIIGTTMYVTNTYCKAGIYKAQVTALKRQITKASELAAEANKEESQDHTIDTTNKDFIDEITKAINGTTDNPKCASSDFLLKLRNLR